MTIAFQKPEWYKAFIKILELSATYANHISPRIERISAKFPNSNPARIKIQNYTLADAIGLENGQLQNAATNELNTEFVFRARTQMNNFGYPLPQGLYDPQHEHDSCGVGFIVHIKNQKSHDIVKKGLQLLCNLNHRGAIGADPLAGDGAGILIQLPDKFFRNYFHKTC